MTSGNPSMGNGSENINITDASRHGLFPPCRTFNEYRDHAERFEVSDREILLDTAFKVNKLYHLINNLMENSPLGAMVAGDMPPMPSGMFPPGMMPPGFPRG